MENLTHSLSKKSYSGNGFGMTSHKSVYDDVFGGPPKFGVPTLAPRFEDYNEIFGGFHSSRGLSIPILDLPVVEEVELAFDVRSSRVDYSEVFGGFDCLDFAVSFEDLLRESNGGDDFSDDAWSPAQSETLSDETDPSVCSERSQSSLNADAYRQFGDFRQSNVSYHGVNQKSSGKMSSTTEHVAQVHSVPAHAYLINNDPTSPIIEDKAPPLQASPSTQFVGRLEERYFKKSISLPTKSSFKDSGTDPHLAGSSGSAFSQKKSFVTVNDISLRTRPLRLPPPSRPPPIFSFGKREPEKTKSKMRASNSYAFERMTGESSPPFYDVEIDASSSKVASVAVKVAAETAQAKIKSAEELVEKKEVLQNRSELQALDSIKTVEEEINNTSNDDSSWKDNKTQGIFTTGGKGMQPVVERQNGIKMTQEPSDSLDAENYIDLVEKPTNLRSGKESLFQVSHKPEGSFAWRQEMEYFEVIETDISLEAVDREKDDESNVLQNKGLEEYKHGTKTATGAPLQQEVKKESKASKEAPKRLEKNKNQLEMSKAACEWAGYSERSNRPVDFSCQNENDKNLEVDLTSYESEMTKKMIKKSKQHLNKDADKNVEELATFERNVVEVEVKESPAHISKRIDSYEVIVDVYLKKANERRPRNCIATEKHDENLEEAVSLGEDVKWEIQHEERKETLEKEENDGKEKELCQEKQNGNIQVEAAEQEDYEKRLNVAIEHDKREDNNRFTKPDCETLEKKETVQETFKLVEDFKRYEVASETSQIDRLAEIWMQEADTHEAAVTFEIEDTEENSRLTSDSTGSTDMSECDTKHEELAEPTEDVNKIKWDEDYEMVNLDLGIHKPPEREDISSYDQAGKLNDQMHETPETTPATTCGEDKKSETKLVDDEQDLYTRSSRLLSEKTSVLSGKNLNDLQHEKEKIWIEDELVKDSNEAGIEIGNSANKHEKKVSQMDCHPEKKRTITHEKGTNGVRMTFSGEYTKEKSTLHQLRAEWTENEKKTGAAFSTVIDDKKNTLNAHQRGTNENVESKQRHAYVTLAPEDRKIEERLHQERELEKEYLRKLEEDREREREREKDRMAVDRAALEARERSYAEARERAERTAIGRSTAEVRQRTTMEARGRLDKESVEARLRAERAAVERATAEARQRAFEKAMAEKASFEARERVEKSFSDKFHASSRNAEMRQSSSSSDPPNLHSQSAGTSNVFRYVYSSSNAGPESESPQRSKARLERYRRTAERAAKALADKNMRDLLAQREQAERSRLAETLDAEVRRWSSGKEGNLRALLSTLQYILGPDSGWQPVPLTEVITSAAVKKAYRKATLCVHPDKLQQRGASIQQKYICEKVFDLLKEAWNTFNSEER